MNKLVNYIFLYILILSIAGFVQRGVPVFNNLGWAVYKIIIVAISFIFLIKIYFNNVYRINKTLNALLFFLIINFIYYFISDSKDSFSFFTAILCYILPVFPIYYFSRKEYINNKLIISIFGLLFVVSVFTFIFVRKSFFIEFAQKDDMTNNIAYYFVALFPFLLYIKRFYRYVICFILFCFILYSAKRGAILLGGVSVFYIIYYTEFVKKKIKLRHILYFIFTLSIVILLVNYFLNTNDYLRERVIGEDSDYTSGRTEIYLYFLNSFINSDLFGMLFGHGFNSTIKLLGIHAHNDWIEILIDYGVVGIYITIFFYYSLYKSIKSSDKELCKRSLNMQFVTLIVSSLFSMAFFTETMTIHCILLGYNLSLLHKTK